MMKTILLAGSALFLMTAAAQAAPLNVCTGKAGGNYEYTGKIIQEYLRGSFEVNIVNTAGSIENAKKIDSGECDVAILQSDAMYTLEKDGEKIKGEPVGDLYDEYAHLICRRKANIDDIGKLNDKTKIMIGEKGSGAQVSWRGMVLADKEEGGDAYSNIPPVYSGGDKSSLVKLVNGDATCMFYMGTPGAKFMTNDVQKLSKDLVLVPIIDKDFDDIEMTNGDGETSSVWRKGTLPYSSYDKIMPTGMLGRKDVQTITVTAKLVVSDKIMNENDDVYGELGFIVPDIRKRLAADKGLTLAD